MIHFVQQAMEALGREIVLAACAARGLQDALLRGVVDRDSQMHALAVGRELLALLDGAEQAFVEPIAPADHVDADGFVRAPPGLREEVATEQEHEPFHFAARALPVGRGERVERQRFDAGARAAASTVVRTAFAPST